MRLPFVIGCALALGACGAYVPPRFVDRPPVTELDDALPIATPEPTNFREVEYLSNIYLRAPIVDALDTTRVSYAADVNSLDEVPRSSFFDPGDTALGVPPVAPFAVESSSGSGDDLALSVTDAMGRRFVLHHDPVDLPQTRTAAAAIIARLAHDVGYRTAPVWALDVDDSELVIGPIDNAHAAHSLEGAIEHFMDAYKRRRVSATAWPIGLDLGPTAMSGTRDDDPNDVIEHRDRRSLRALQVLLAWLDLGDIGPGSARDVYVGPADRGHVDHVLVWLGKGLGVHRLMQGRPVESAVGVVRGNPLTNLFTLGLDRGDPHPSAPEARSLAVLSPRVDPEANPARPWEPFDRLQAPDGYWATKRLLSVSLARITSAVAAGHVDDRAVATRLVKTLVTRRRELAAYWMKKVTPCEVAAVVGRRLVIEDRALQAGVARAARSRYAIVVLSDAGTPLARLAPRPTARGRFLVDVPGSLLVRRGYLVVRVTAVRDGKPLPRAFEVHVVPAKRGLRVIGIRH